MRNFNVERRAIIFGFLLLGVLLIFPTAASADGMEQPVSGETVGADRSTVVPSSQGKTAPPIRKVGRTGNTKALSDFELAKYQYCGQDSDCVIAINGCCDCVNGGIEVAVNKDRVEAFRKRFECLHVKCGMKKADPPCKSGVVSCVSHRCRYYDVSRSETGEDGF